MDGRCPKMTREVWKEGKDGGNSMKDDKSSMAGELTPRTQNTDLDHHSLLSWENLELHQRDTCTHKCAHAYAFSMGGIWEIRRKCERGENIPQSNNHHYSFLSF